MTAGTVFVRNPARRYVISLADPAWVKTLGYLQCDPSMEGAPPEECGLKVEQAGPFVRLLEPGAEGRNFASIGDLRDHLHGRFFIESMEGDLPLLHAACLLYAGRRILLVGPKNAGKSTLSLALALAGFAIEGDENVFVSRSGVTARPRACRVKESSFKVLPDLAALADAAPFITDYHGRKIYNLQPDWLGNSWRIATGKADIVIVMHANHGGMSSVRRLPPLMLTRALMAETGFPERGKGAGVAALAGMAATATGYDLSVGAIQSAVESVKTIVLGQ